MGSVSILSPIDLATVLVYGFAILIHGFWVGRRNEGVDDYFLAGRKLSFGIIGASLYASNMSGSSFVGLMGASYSHGFAVYHYEWTAAAVLVVFAFFMLPVFLRGRISTLPEYLERRYDRRCRRAFSGFTIFAILFIDMAGALYAGGLVLTLVFPTLPLAGAVFALASVAGLYTVAGGLAAVVVTDAIQALLLMLGSSLIVVFGLREVGGWEAFQARLTPDQTTLWRPVDDAFLPWPGILAVVLLGFYYWTLNQFVVQRTLGAKNLEAGQRGALLAGLLKIPNLFLMVVPGVLATVLFPGLDNPDLVFPKLAFELLPLGLRGLILTAVVAAIMSSLDSALNAAASLITYDFVQPLRPEASSARLLRMGQAITAVCLGVAVIYAPTIQAFENLFGYVQSILAYVTPPAVAVYLGGLFSRRITSKAAFAVLVGGFSTGAGAFVAIEIAGLPQRFGASAPHFSYAAVVMFVASLAALRVFSPSAREGSQMLPMVHPNDWALPWRRPLLSDPRVQAAALMVVLLLSLWVVP